MAILTPGCRIDGATYAGICTAPGGALYALLLLDAAPPKRLSWPDATAWTQGLDASLPSRTEAALLFALLGDKFTKAWHWTHEAASWDASYAWTCGFSYGDQSYDHKSFEGCARAVRRLPLQSFDSLLSLAARAQAA